MYMNVQMFSITRQVQGHSGLALSKVIQVRQGFQLVQSVSTEHLAT